MFIIEGIITTLFSGVIFFVLPDYPKSPRSNKWLDPDEQEYLEARLGDRAPKADDPAFSTQEVIATLKSPIQWSFTFSQMLINLGMYALQWYLPTLTTSFGFTSLPANQLLNIPPAAAGVIGVILGSTILRLAVASRPIQLMCAILLPVCIKANLIGYTTPGSSCPLSYSSLSQHQLGYTSRVCWEPSSSLYITSLSFPGARPQ